MKVTKHHVRWLIRRDDPICQAIDPTLTEDDLRDIHCFARLIGNVAEDKQGRVVGFMVYRLTKHTIELVRIVVHPDYHRRGAGRDMLEKLARKVVKSVKRDRVVANVPEGNLQAQLLMRSCGFEAVRVDPSRADGPTTYRFVLRPKKETGCTTRTV